MCEKGPVIVTCVASPSEYTSPHASYMISGMITDEKGIDVTHDVTDEECRRSAEIVSRHMGRKWSHFSGIECLMLKTTFHTYHK